jgi:hypothetical protein
LEDEEANDSAARAMRRRRKEGKVGEKSSVNGSAHVSGVQEGERSKVVGERALATRAGFKG